MHALRLRLHGGVILVLRAFWCSSGQGAPEVSRRERQLAISHRSLAVLTRMSRL